MLNVCMLPYSSNLLLGTKIAWNCLVLIYSYFRKQLKIQKKFLLNRLQKQINDLLKFTCNT